jgi:hypothetical protein
MPEPALVVMLVLASATVADARDLAVEVTVRNTGSEVVRLNALAFPYAAAVLEVRTAAGASVALIPPGMPPVDDGVTGRIDLAPGAVQTFHYSGAVLFDAPLPAGRYAIRFHAALGAGSHGRDGLASEWVPFTVSDS